jgi:dephospho-CoA kinase
MALFFITGIAGAGKTTVLKELKSRNYKVYDADEGLSFWANKSTGEKASASDHTLTTDAKFFEEHDWYIDKEAIEKLAKEAESETIFICGSVANEKDVWSYFEKVFCLYVDDDSLIQRIKTRSDKDFGKSEHELGHLLELNKNVRSKYKSLGAVIIDATQSANKIADKITAIIKPTDG